MRPRVYGPRSLILTTTERPLSRSVTFAHEASGSERCAAVAVTVSRISPLAVCLPTRLYQAAFPNRLIPVARRGIQDGFGMPPQALVAGSKPVRGGCTCSELCSVDEATVTGPSAQTGDWMFGAAPFAHGKPVESPGE